MDVRLLCLSCVVQVSASATSWSLVQRSPTECGCVIYRPQRRRPGPEVGRRARRKNIVIIYSYLLCSKCGCWQPNIVGCDLTVFFPLKHSRRFGMRGNDSLGRQKNANNFFEGKPKKTVFYELKQWSKEDIKTYFTNIHCKLDEFTKPTGARKLLKAPYT